VVKYAGAAYLIYLGVRAFLDRESFDLSSGAASVSLKSVFVQSVASNVLNPKVALFFLAFLLQFADPASPGGAALQLLTLGLTLALLTWAVFSVLGYFCGGLGRQLRSRPGYANALHWLTGGILVGLGVRLAFSERR
jgi:threonine/homoserine/homoserine lactone efflux protein